jgi:cytochrome c-type biogenesis protein CcsB
MDLGIVGLFLWKIVIICYAVVSTAIFLYLTREKLSNPDWSRLLVVGGFLVQSVLVMWLWIETGILPVGTLSKALRFFSWALAALYIFVLYRYRLSQLGLVLLPLATIMWALGGPMREAKASSPLLASPWLTVHGIFSFLGEATLVGAFGVSVLYLLQERRIRKRISPSFLARLPSLEVLDHITYKCMAWGFVLLTAGIVAGAVWANQAWGSYWTWQAKETWALATWLLYAGLLHQRVSSGWGGRKGALLLIVGFGFLLFTFIGAGFMGSGPHRFDRLQG